MPLRQILCSYCALETHVPLSLKHISSPYRAIQTLLKLRGEKREKKILGSRGEGEKRVVGEGREKRRDETKPLYFTLCSTYLNQKKILYFHGIFF